MDMFWKGQGGGCDSTQGHDWPEVVVLDDGLIVCHLVKSGLGHRMDGGGIRGKDQIGFDVYT